MIKMVLVCLNEIGCPEDITTLLTKFLGLAIKLMNKTNDLRTSQIEETDDDFGYLQPTKRQKTS